MELTTDNFGLDELRCKCKRCQLQQPHKLQEKPLLALQWVREQFGKPIYLNSAYRCALHPSEAKKSRPGRHFKGTAFDIRVPWGRDRAILLDLLRQAGFNAFGYANSFIHADYGRKFPTTWGYS